MFDIIIGNPIVDIEHFGFTKKNSIRIEERFLPKILVDLGIFKSNSEVRKNRPDLFIELNKLDFLEIKVGKKHLYILVGE